MILPGSYGAAVMSLRGRSAALVYPRHSTTTSILAPDGPLPCCNFTDVDDFYPLHERKLEVDPFPKL